jgi:long-chain fatty acid transport protein
MRTLSKPIFRASGGVSGRVIALAALMSGAFGATVLAPSDAAASGYLTARFGTDHGTPASPNGFAVYFNPAALGGTTGTTITGDVSLLLRWASYQRGVDALSASDEATKQDPAYRSANVGRANLLNLLALPYLGVNTDFGGSKYLRGGYAFYIPFGGMATWDRRDPTQGGTIDGVSRWHNISGQILAIYNTLAFAVKVHETFTIGANVSGIIHNVATVRARNADGSDDTISNGQLVEGRSLLEAHGFNLSAALGVYWEPTDTVKLGLSYTSQPGFGETKMSGTLKTQLAGTQPDSKEVDFFQTYPDIIRLGGAVKATEKLELRGDLEFVRWSVFDKQCVVPKGDKCNVAEDGRDLSGGKVILNIPRRWNDAIGIRVGPGYQLNDDLELFGSVGFTTPAVPKATIDASTIDSQRLYGTVGAKYRFSEHFALAASYNHIHYFTVNTNGANDQEIAGHPAKGPDGGAYNASRSPSADGRYKSEIGFLNINAAYTF